MIWRIDPFWLAMGAVMVSMLMFILGFYMDKIMGKDGFGPTGNMVVMTIAFFVGIYGANRYGFYFRDLHMAVTGGLTAAFIGFAFMAVLKGIFFRA